MNTNADLNIICYLVHYPNLLYNYMDDIEPYQFVNTNARLIWTAITDLVKKHGVVPTIEEVEWYLRDSDKFDLSALAQTSCNLDLQQVYDSTLVTPATGDRILKWVAEQELRQVGQYIASSQTEVVSLEQQMKHLSEVRRKLTGLEEMVAEEEDELLIPFSKEAIETLEETMLDMSIHDTVPTCLPLLNALTRGGKHIGEVSLTIAASGFGKTTYLLNDALFAARHCNRRVVMYSLDDSKGNLYKRIWNHIAKTSGDDIDLTEFREMVEDNINEFHDRFILRIFPRASLTPAALENDLEKIRRKLRERARKEGRDQDEAEIIDQVTLDYIGEMKPPKHMNSAPKHEKLGEIGRLLGGISTRQETHITTAMQVNREGYKTDMLFLYNVAQSLELIYPMKLVTAFVCNEFEAAEGIARVAVLKNTWGEKNYAIPVNVNFAQNRIWEAADAELWPIARKGVSQPYEREEDDEKYKTSTERKRTRGKWGGAATG